jgi:phosphoglycerate dehydrogenase-like enzyme
MSPSAEDVAPPCGVENSADRIAATEFHTERPVSAVVYREDSYTKQPLRRNEPTTRKPVVFLGRDYILNQILDEVGRRLEHDGCEIVRGAGATPPAHTDYPPGEWPRLFGRADVILISTRTRCPRDLLLAAPRLRGIVFPTIGTEAVDLADAQKLGVVIGHGPTPETFVGMAEACVMLIAALLLDLSGKERMTRLNLPRPAPLEMRAQLVRGKTIGLVGFGRIARAVAERLRGWDTRILACHPRLPKDQAPSGVELVNLPQLLSESDVVSLHVPLTGETRGMIGAAELARMKPTAFLVNTARAGVVDEDALLDALKNGRLAGAALDVFGKEPLPPDSPLRDFKNVVVTSHMVGHAREANESLIPAAVENVLRILRDEPPLYLRNPAVLPAWRARIAHLPRLGRDGAC